jgi:hypothetical protein
VGGIGKDGYSSTMMKDFISLCFALLCSQTLECRRCAMAVAKASTSNVAEIVEGLVGSKVVGEQFNGGSSWSSSYIVRTEGWYFCRCFCLLPELCSSMTAC